MEEGQIGISEELFVELVDCDIITITRLRLLELIVRLKNGDVTALSDLEALVK